MFNWIRDKCQKQGWEAFLKGHTFDGLWVLGCVLKLYVTLEQQRFEVWASLYMQIF